MIDRRRVMIGGGIGLASALGGTAAWRRSTSLSSYEAAARAMRSALRGDPQIHDLIRFATLAANGHNTQPWRFHVEGRAIRIAPDFARRTPVVDPDDHHVFASLGGAAENLAIAAAAQRRPASVEFDSRQPSLIVRLGEGSGEFAALAAAIPRRQSTRANYDGRPLAVGQLKLLEQAAEVGGIDTVLLTDRRAITRVKQLVIAGNSAQLRDRAFIAELRAWLRFSPAEALRTRDGLFSATSGNPVAPNWLGRQLFDRLFDADAENAKYASAIDSSAGVAVFVAERADPEHWAAAGRASQRFALQATALGLTCAYLNQPVEVAGLRNDLAALAGLPGRRPDIVMRFGRGATLPFSLRRPVPELLV
ncbi:MAG: Tat pathway signal protein [Sphingomicrobium sp.]